MSAEDTEITRISPLITDENMLPPKEMPQIAEEPRQNKTTTTRLYVIIIVLVVLIIAIIAFVVLRKDNTGAAPPPGKGRKRQQNNAESQQAPPPSAHDIILDNFTDEQLLEMAEAGNMPTSGAADEHYNDTPDYESDAEEDLLEQHRGEFSNFGESATHTSTCGEPLIKGGFCKTETQQGAKCARHSREREETIEDDE